MSQWLRRKIISFMGNVYVWLDKGLEHETGEILGVHIDMDLQQKTRRELCRHIENKFGWEEDSFWNLESTQKTENKYFLQYQAIIMQIKLMFSYWIFG